MLNGELQEERKNVISKIWSYMKRKREVESD
jgi:hypothetical protein